MKKSISFILCLALAVCLCTGLASAEEGLRNFSRVNKYSPELFSDVTPGSWYVENVKNAYELGLMEGQGAGSFGAESGVTYAETVALAARIHSIYRTGAADFVEGEPWYQVYYDYAVANRIISSGQFRDYNSAASRFYFVAILVRAMPDTAFAIKNYVEAGAISDVVFSTAGDVYTFYRAGILDGVNDKGDFDPWSDIKRSETAAVVSRMALTELRLEFTLTGGGDGAQEQGDLLEYLRLAYSEAQTGLLIIALNQDAAALSRSMTQLEKTFTILEKVCQMTKDSTEFAKVYEYSSTALLYCQETAKIIQELINAPSPLGWSTVNRNYNELLVYINGAVNEAAK